MVWKDGRKDRKKCRVQQRYKPSLQKKQTPYKTESYNIYSEKTYDAETIRKRRKKPFEISAAPFYPPCMLERERT